MNKKRGERKGELTSNHIIILIILIISFAIIMFLWWQFKWDPEIDRQVCHQTVIFKASTPALIGQKIVDLSLKCKTENKCISDKWIGKGNCGDGDYKTYRINGEEAEEDIKEVFADSLADCWWMMGEGKVDVFPRELVDEKKCVICSVIDFDEDFKEKTDVDVIYKFQNYLAETKIPNKEYTYLGYLTDTKGELEHFGEKDFEKEGVNREQDNIQFVSTYPEMKLDVNKKYAVVFTQWSLGNLIRKGVSIASFVGFNLIPVGKIFKIGKIFVSVIRKGKTALSFAAFFVGDASGDKLALLFYPSKIAPFAYSIQLVEFDKDELDKIGCKSFENLV